MPNYNCEIDVRPKRKGGGVSLYIHSALQYKLRRDLQLGGDVNSVFIEIYKTTTNTKHNIICGCVYSMRVLNGQARYEIADTENMGIFHAVLHYRIGKRTKKH